MADSPINQFPVLATDVPAGSYFGYDRWNGSAFETVKILQADLANTLGAPNMANGNRGLTGDRLHDGNNRRWSITKLKDCTFETGTAPTLGLASINLNGTGATGSDMTHRFRAASSTIAEMYGDLATKFYGNTSVTLSSANPALNVSNSGAGAAVVGTGSSGNGVSGVSTLGAGVTGETVSGVGVKGASVSGKGGAFRNQVLVEEFTGADEIQEASTLFQVKSTTRAALPAPRMTSVQKNAIPSPATGAVVFDTTTNRYEFYNGTFWQGMAMRFYSVFFTSWNPTDAQTVAFGAVGLTPQLASLSPAPYEIVMRGNGVIRGCDFTTFASGVAGTNEAWQLFVRHNGVDHLVQSVSSAAATRVFTNTSLNIPYVNGDIVRMIFVNPTWATNPTNLAGGGHLILQ
jgi:hypothetical protein